MQDSIRRPMTDVQQRQAARHFADFWKGKGYEKGESQKFWLSLLNEVYGVEHPAEFISFEDQVHLDHTSFIDGHIPLTRVLIEQKSLGKNLLEKIRQSDGSFLTPFQQAKRYITELPVDQHPKWVITCNFEKFLVYDMNRPNGEPEEILLENLPTEYYRLNFLVDTGSTTLQKEMEISIQAGELVGKLYDAFLKQYFTRRSIPNGQDVKPYYVISFIVETLTCVAVYAVVLLLRLNLAAVYIPGSALNFYLLLFPISLIVAELICLLLINRSVYAAKRSAVVVINSQQMQTNASAATLQPNETQAAPDGKVTDKRTESTATAVADDSIEVKENQVNAPTTSAAPEEVRKPE